MSNYQRCKGFQFYKMDSKSRVSIPPSWRLEPGDSLFLHLSMQHGMPMLEVFGLEVYEERVQRIVDSDKTAQKKSSLLGLLATICREVFPDQRGRLLIPNDLRKRLGIAVVTEVVLAGRGTHFEIWNKENFDAFQSIESTLPEENELGIF